MTVNDHECRHGFLRNLKLAFAQFAQVSLLSELLLSALESLSLTSLTTSISGSKVWASWLSVSSRVVECAWYDFGVVSTAESEEKVELLAEEVLSEDRLLGVSGRGGAPASAG
mmetsp:Transcript_13864/g.19749  ORF Transcript_13864/g.19749 Transcript_13864/m.19749 type:complete len:113 (+) Transcript_13864:254-592(+)